MVLETLLHGAPRLHLEHTALAFLDERGHLLLGSLENVAHLGERVVISDGVTHADGEAKVQDEVVADLLDLVHEHARHLRAELVEAHVDQAAGLGPERALVDDAGDHLAILDEHRGVFGVEVARKALAAVVAIRLGLQVDTRRDDGRKDLLAGPERVVLARLVLVRHHDCRDGDAAVKVVDPHEDVVELVLVDKDVAAGHAPGRQERVLHDAHDRAVALRRHDHLVHHHHGLGLRTRGEALRHMQVHLIAVKVSVVGRGHTEVHAERGPVHHADTVAHDTHLVERRLAVEQHHVVVCEVALHDPAALEQDLVRVHVAQVHPHAVVAHNVAGAGVLGRAVADEKLHALDVEAGDALRDGEVERNGPRHADLIDTEVGVRSNHSTRGKVDTLAHEVAAHAALFPDQALPQGFERLAALLLRLRLVRQLVVDERRDVVLQQGHILLHYVLGVAVALAVHDPEVSFDDVTQLVREVIVRARSAAHGDGRTHVRRGNGQHGHD
mmetsp:Transcript_26014/g.73791  ORF Transcript_26014/g.73791 Transcript_26014/m.73791 type:complete len:498 (+) Transcript_26014:2487-3980(+)